METPTQLPQSTPKYCRVEEIMSRNLEELDPSIALMNYKSYMKF